MQLCRGQMLQLQRGLYQTRSAGCAQQGQCLQASADLHVSRRNEILLSLDLTLRKYLFAAYRLSKEIQHLYLESWSLHHDYRLAM